MKTKSLVLALSAVTLFSAGVIVAQAEGTWQHGYGVSAAYANYHHGSKIRDCTISFQYQ